jgi:hypothetical protein
MGEPEPSGVAAQWGGFGLDEKEPMLRPKIGSPTAEAMGDPGRVVSAA